MKKKRSVILIDSKKAAYNSNKKLLDNLDEIVKKTGKLKIKKGL